MKPQYRYRSAITGLYVSKAYAQKHPEKTVRERVQQKPACNSKR